MFSDKVKQKTRCPPHLSAVHMNRVPMLTPTAPSARAAANPRPSAMPPDAMKGTFRSLAALAS